MPALLHFSTDYPFSNRAAVYGDGCFTTIAVEQARAELLSRHIKRLQQASNKLKLSIDERDWALLQNQLQASARSLQKGVIKVLLSAGQGGRGYLRSADGSPQCYIQTLPPVAHYEKWRQSGINLGVSPFTLSMQPGMCGVKHLNRLEQVMIKEHGSQHEDDLVLDVEDMIVEVSAGNLFWCAYGRWFTPNLEFCGVEGVMRNLVVDCLQGSNQQVNAVRSQLNALHQATDVLICNSLMRLVPVNNIQLPGQALLSFNNTRVAAIAAQVVEAIKLESE